MSGDLDESAKDVNQSIWPGFEQSSPILVKGEHRGW
ncbi:hypothetical protein [Sporisorium scitamineum]|uniref:Uncharacterized protein n=1 Tax=Sporisorium scitamineum TaxID=49012 RepID=A0A0F7RZW7_9BASI|nr:hypothetical protein [Sporisorium scitamineum]